MLVYGENRKSISPGSLGSKASKVYVISEDEKLTTAEAEHAEFRSDRFLAAVNHRGSDPFQLAYVVRAVTPGQYHHPAATVSDMYRPEYRANTPTGQVTISR